MRRLTALVLAVLAGCAGERLGPAPHRGSALFVDQIDEGRAVLIDAQGRVVRWRASQLPPGTREGTWLGEPPDPAWVARITALRRALSQDDDGGDLTLQ